MAASVPCISISSNSFPRTPTSLNSSPVFNFGSNIGVIERKQLGIVASSKSNQDFKLNSKTESSEVTRELNRKKLESQVDIKTGFEEMKHRFLQFKKQKYLENLEHFQSLAIAQAPKFLVIACADSRVCPSQILGFQPGEAFIVRNVANLVPPFENGPTETNAALEFSVNTLEVEKILVIGHSCCGGIIALMSMPDEVDSSFIRNWVINGKDAKISTKAAASHLSFDQQCSHCEKESINRSLLNLLTYKWVEERVNKGLLSLHGGYYNFIDCTFEKWTLDYNPKSNVKEGGSRYSLKNREFWS